MSETTRTLKLTLTYGDYTERNYNIAWQNNADVAQKVKAFNTAAQNSESTVAQTFLSENGAAPTAITAATTIVKTEEVIYSA